MPKGMIDYHCHLLPGVDDGFKDLSSTLQALNYYEQIGVNEVWCTPHIMEDIPNQTQSLRNRFTLLTEKYQGPISLHLAAEYMMDEEFEKRLKEEDLLPIGIDADHLLVETSYFNPPARLEAIIERIMSSGFYPILAHPERYMYMNEKAYQKWHQRGVKMQINIPSLIGGYGKEVQKKAFWLLKHKYYSILGSDMHRITEIGKFEVKKSIIPLLTELSHCTL